MTKIVSIKKVQEAAKRRAPGYVDAVMAAGTLVSETHISLSDKSFDRIAIEYANAGPGSCLHRILARFGVSFSRQCKCRNRIRQMNRWGCDGCEEHIEEIVGWLREEATARGLPYLDLAGRMLVRLAIRNARKAK